PKNTDDDAAFDVKENENEVHVSPSSSDKPKKHDENAKRVDKGKSPVDLSPEVKDLRVEFQEFLVNNTNRVNATSAHVTVAEPKPTNSTNSFNTASPFDTAGHTQEEGIDYDEVFALVARIKAIRLFLTYASFIGFMVYQMDVKSSFLYGTIKEEVYVCQPLGFEDSYYHDKVYKVVKELYGLHQAPRAWYETLANYLLENGFQKGKIDQTLFIKKQKGDILLVQVYVDDIIFGSTNKEQCKAFEKLVKDKFQMSSMGELTFFLGLQVKQKDDGIFISQDKYVAEILRKFGFTNVKSASTLIETEKPLLKDPDAEDVDIHIYRYLKGKLHLGLWYPKDSPFNLVAYSDSDFAGASLDRKSTTGEDIQCAGSDTRPHMLDRTDFASWQQQIRLYYRGKENGVNILKSIDEGPYQMGTVRETLTESTEGAPQFGPERPRVYSNLTPEEKDRFVMAIKLNRGLRDSNYDQLYAYLKQHETHAKEKKMMLESSSSTPVPQPLADSSSPTEDLIENLTNTLALFTQSYKTFLSQTNNQLRTSSNARNQATVQDGRVVVQNVQGRQNRGHWMNPQGGSAAGYEGAQNRVGNVNPSQARSGQARPSQARPVKCYNCNDRMSKSYDGPASSITRSADDRLAMNMVCIVGASSMLESNVSQSSAWNTLSILSARSWIGCSSTSSSKALSCPPARNNNCSASKATPFS
nr:putative ribonuclease H-like domain-containing protein [Tanacetum cinerariifolium]